MKDTVQLLQSYAFYESIPIAVDTIMVLRPLYKMSRIDISGKSESRKN